MPLTLQPTFNPQWLLISFILINSIVTIESTPGYLNISSNLVWEQNATTFAGNGTAGASSGQLHSPRGITISSDDILYIADYYNSRIVMKNITSSTIIGFIGTGIGSGVSQLYASNDVFLSGSFLYVLDTDNDRVQRWSSNGSNPSNALPQYAYGNYLAFFMFIDKYNNLYISVTYNAMVMRFTGNWSVGKVIAGNGTAGSQASLLNSPEGMFVDDNLNLFVADHNNHRIQMWTYGATSGKTVAGTGTNGSTLSQLSNPNSVVLDRNANMYISDEGNDRILRWALNSTYGVCIAACTGTTGNGMNQLHAPTGFAFDSAGSLYVADYVNNRLQKFAVSSPVTTHGTTVKPTVITTSLSSLRPTSSYYLTTKLLTSTMLLSSKTAEKTSTMQPTTTLSSTSSVQTTSRNPTTRNAVTTSQLLSTEKRITTPAFLAGTSMEPQATSFSSTHSIQTTARNLFTTSQLPTTENGMTTSTPSVRTSTASPTTTLSSTSLAQVTLQNLLTNTQSSPAENHETASINSLHSTTKEHSIVTSTETVSISLVPSTHRYETASTSAAHLTTMEQIALSSTNTLLETTASKRTVTSSSLIADSHETTSTPSATYSSTEKSATLSSTEMLSSTKTSKTIVTSTPSPTVNQAITSTYLTQLASSEQTIVSLIEANKETTISTVAISSTNNQMITISAHLGTVEQPSLSSTEVLLKTTALKITVAPPISSTKFHETTTGAHSTSTGQTTSSSMRTSFEPTTSRASEVASTSSTDTVVRSTLVPVYVETVKLSTLISTKTSLENTKSKSVTTDNHLGSSTVTLTFTGSTRDTSHSFKSTHSQISTSTIQLNNCLNISIRLWPNNPSVFNPFQVQRSADFSISSSVDLICFQTLDISEQWSVEKCVDFICSTGVIIKYPSINMKLSELFVPSKTLNYGIYRMTLAVQRNILPRWVSSTSSFTEIVRSSIKVQLIEGSPPLITQGKEQNLFLNPGRFSIDPDQTILNSTDWSYQYFCTIHDQKMSYNANETLFLMDDLSCPCLISLRSWEYGSNTSHSSLTIFGGSLQANTTYHFRVTLTNIEDSSAVFSGDLLVQVEENSSMTILIECIISSICFQKNGYEMINPSTQIALRSFCINNCFNTSSNLRIEWKIYYAKINNQWIFLANQTDYLNRWIFGANRSNITVSEDFLDTYSTIRYWRFEVIYTSDLMNSTGVINLMINSPPVNGSCAISPLNGSATTTVFRLECLNWLDEDGIKDYSFYTWTADRSSWLMLAYNISTSFDFRMPIGAWNSTLLEVLVRIRDIYYSTTEFYLHPVSVASDIHSFVPLISTIISNELTVNPLLQSLYGGNQNDVCQLLTSLGQVLNILAEENLQLALNNTSAVSISVSTLSDNYSLVIDHPRTFSNDTFIFTDYTVQLNTFANVQEYLINFMQNLTITMIDSLILQGSTLAELTAMTNQLTRNALISASTKCSQLSRALDTYASSIPFEDVQIASNYIMQCASQVLTAVNAPLQKRGVVLDLDYSRANALPADYDADLDSIWSNRNFFADGDDFSSDTIDKNRNLYYQRELATMIHSQFEETMLMITHALNVHLNIEQSILFNTSSMIMSLKRMETVAMTNQFLQLNEDTQIFVPNDLSLTQNSTISLRCLQTPLALSGNEPYANLNLSRLLLLTIFDENANELEVHNTSSQLIEFFIPRDRSLIVPPMSVQNVSSLSSDGLINNHQFNLHFVNITQQNSNITVSVHWEMLSLNNSLGYMLIYKFDQIPQLNRLINQIDGWLMLCPSRNVHFLDTTNDDVLRYFIDNGKTSTHRSVIFGVRELNSTEFDIYCVNLSTNVLISDRYFHFSSDYQLRIYTSGCYYLDSNQNWQSDGLLVGSRTSVNRTQCLSSHLSTFASGFVVLPTPINWNYVFANANFVKNKTIYLTIILIIVLFIILAIYARHLDNQAKDKFGVTVLSDNRPGTDYFYQVVLFTGTRRNAGTSAKVYLKLSGGDDQSETRHLSTTDRKAFQRGSIDSFIFAVPKSLGLLNYVHVWHDNSGDYSSPTWFLKYLIVRDLQTMEKFYFISQQWLAVEKRDGKVERIIPVSNDEQLQKFVHSNAEKFFYHLSDEHLWFSVFFRPLATTFTHLQRCVCCFVLLYVVMLFNILYYTQIEAAKLQTNESNSKIDSFVMKKEQIVIGITVDILTFIPSILLVTFFQRIHSHRPSGQVSPIVDAIWKRISKKKNTTKKNAFLFPWWCLFIAYGVSFLLIGASIVLIIARGIELGDSVIRKWLTSFVIGLISSNVLTQPIKVFFVSILLSKLRFFAKNDTNEELYLNGTDGNISGRFSTVDRSLTEVRPLSKVQVAQARIDRLRQIQMWSYIQHVVFYTCFLSILYLLSYANRNPHSSEQVRHLTKFFLSSNYSKVSTVDQYWQWLENSFVENTRAQSWYNGDPPQDLAGFLSDKTNRLIGWPVIRQLRIKTNSTCRVPTLVYPIIPKCYRDYTLFNADHQSWLPEWQLTNKNNMLYSQAIANAFTYRSDHQFEGNSGYIYELRGSLDEMRSNLTELRQWSWIDSRTRMVIIQMSLYNPNVQLFTSVRFQMDFLSTGGVFLHYRIDPIDFHDQLQSFSSLFHLLCGIIYILFLLYFASIEIDLLIKQKTKYFFSFWSWIEWSIIVSSWAGVGIYIRRFREASRIRQIFAQTNGYQYINIQFSAFLEETLMILFGFCCFVGTIKCVYFLSSATSRFSQFNKLLKHIQKDLFYFSCIFLILFLAFLGLYYSLFSSSTNILDIVVMLSRLFLFRFDVKALYEADTFLGPLVSVLFILLMFFICFPMFFSIINGGIRYLRRMKKDIGKEESDDLLPYILMKIQVTLGMTESTPGQDSDNQPHSELEERTNEEAQLQTPMEQLAKKITELAIAVDKLKIVPTKSLKVTTTSSGVIYDDICVDNLE